MVSLLTLVTATVAAAATATSTHAFPSQEFARTGVITDVPLDTGASTVGPLDSRRISCPVMAGLVNEGYLKPDERGVVSDAQVKQALIDIGTDPSFAEAQVVGAVMYPHDHVDKQDKRDRCLPASWCWMKKKWNKGKQTEETTRYINVYKMVGLQTVEHGISTGVRGGAVNVPEFENDPCHGEYPCEAKFQEFWAPCANKDGNFDKESILCIVCKAQRKGDRAGEWSYNPSRSLRNWQIVTAMLGMVEAFGHFPEGEKPTHPDTYLTLEEIRTLVMDGRFPKWEHREWGGMSRFALSTQLDSELPCVDEAWWQDSACPSSTGETCTPVVGWCGGGATCMSSGYCVCPQDENGISMCAKGGQCERRSNASCTYFGEPCHATLANSPSAPW
eukprot:GFYU01004194.1.p1 GENE.GFYU01004194.1~~GFYU01004194.1.p1  ORF type:complete len:389 (+),score=87.87 GFYU01004194.1:43-1209(+)